MSQPARLFSLQSIDSKLDKSRARLKEIELAIRDITKLAAAEKAVDQAENNQNTASKALKRAEEDVQVQQDKIDHNQKALYSGSVTNPKELEDLQQEAEALKRYLGDLEEVQLDKMIAYDETQATKHDSDELFLNVQEETDNKNNLLINEQKEIMQIVAKMESEREDEIEGIDEDDIALYTRLRESKRGVAVAEIVEDNCTACGTTLTASKAQESRSRIKIAICDNCGRIIHTR